MKTSFFFQKTKAVILVYIDKSLQSFLINLIETVADLFWICKINLNFLEKKKKNPPKQLKNTKNYIWNKYKSNQMLYMHKHFYDVIAKRIFLNLENFYRRHNTVTFTVNDLTSTKRTRAKTGSWETLTVKGNVKNNGR